MVRFSLLFFFLLCASGYAQLTPGGGGNASVVACVGSPGNTTGTYQKTICQTAAGALYSCNNSSGCSVAADWIAQGVVTTYKFLANYNGTTFAGSTTSAAINVYSLPALASVRGARISTVTQFTASGLTSMPCSLGDSSSHVLYSGGTTLDVSQAVTNTSAVWTGGFINSTLASNTVVLYCSASGANLSTLTAGQIEIVIDVVTEPTSSTVVQ